MQGRGRLGAGSYRRKQAATHGKRQNRHETSPRATIEQGFGSQTKEGQEEGEGQRGDRQGCRRSRGRKEGSIESNRGQGGSQARGPDASH